MQPWMLAWLSAYLLLSGAGAASVTSTEGSGQDSLASSVIHSSHGPDTVNDAVSASRFQLGKVDSALATSVDQQRHLQQQANPTWQAIADTDHHTGRSLLASKGVGGDSDDADVDEPNQQRASNIRSGRTLTKLYMLPWLLPPSQVKFPYIGAENNLRRLLRVQNKNRWITIFVFSSPVRRWVLNAIYSYVRIGQARSYIVATMDAASLAECKAFRLPCYDASYVDKELDNIAAAAAQRPKDDRANAVLAKIAETRTAVQKGRSGSSTSRRLQEFDSSGAAFDIHFSTHQTSEDLQPGLDSAGTQEDAGMPAGQHMTEDLLPHQEQDEGEEGLMSSTLRQLLSASSSSGTADIGSNAYLRMVWGKIVILRDVLRLGYHAHFSDVDVTYLREVYRSFNLLFLKYRVDAVLMKENVAELTDPDNPMSPVRRVNLLNTGVYVMRATNGTVRMVEDWLAFSGPAIAAGLHDQAIFNLMAFTHYAVCAGMTTCLAARAAGWPTIFRHPQQFGMQVCPGMFSQPCDPMRLYVHAVCTSGWGSQEGGKALYWTKYKLWLVDEVGHPLYRDEEQGNAVGVIKSKEPPPVHPFLPCKGPAWVNMQQQGS